MSEDKEPCVKVVLVDTSFLITLIDKGRANHETAKAYFKFWIDAKVRLYISTVVIAEYNVKGRIADIVMQHLTALPFNYSHAITTADLAAKKDLAKKEKTWPQTDKARDAIKDDLKLFAQTHSSGALLFVTDDQRTCKVVDFLRKNETIQFQVCPLWEPFDHTMARTGDRGLL